MELPPVWPTLLLDCSANCPRKVLDWPATTIASHDTTSSKHAALCIMEQPLFAGSGAEWERLDCLAARMPTGGIFVSLTQFDPL